jgi:hypothetical protein
VADFRDLPFIAAGRRYVLFLNWNEDHGSYRLTDYSSGAREIDRNNPNFLPARVHELARILQEPEGQSRELTAWLVDLTGNPRTRYDGVYDLLKNSLRYDLFSSPSENPDTRHLDMVRNLEDPDDTQRSRIGDAAYKQISQYMSDDRYFDRHRTMELLAAHAVKWDSERFADRAFELLQTTRQTTISKIEILMRSISGASHDPSLTGIYHEWGEAMLRKSEVDEKCREIIARFLARYRDIKGGRSSSDPR